MGQRRSQISLRTFVSALATWVLCGAALLSGASVAGADPLSGLTDPVREATAPVVETVETVVPPVSTPAPPAPVPAPEVSPSPAVRSPSPSAVTEAANHTAKAATEAVTKAAGTVAAAADEATREAEKGTGEATAAAQETTGQATASVDGVLGTAATAGTNSVTGKSGGAPAGTASSRAKSGSDGTRPTTVDAAPPEAADPASLPAKLWHPFIRVWPAVALTAERALADFVGHWSRAVLALFEESGGGSLRGEGGALASSAPASHSSDQPPFSWLSPPSLSPYGWIAGEAALPVFVFFLILAAGTLAILLAMRRELGEPLLPRRITRWWH
jgi:hypothetical protein